VRTMATNLGSYMVAHDRHEAAAGQPAPVAAAGTRATAAATAIVGADGDGAMQTATRATDADSNGARRCLRRAQPAPSTTTPTDPALDVLPRPSMPPQRNPSSGRSARVGGYRRHHGNRCGDSSRRHRRRWSDADRNRGDRRRQRPRPAVLAQPGSTEHRDGEAALGAGHSSRCHHHRDPRPSTRSGAGTRNHAEQRPVLQRSQRWPYPP
jgi:hypothetical protein